MANKVINIGCRLNQYEGEAINTILEKHNSEIGDVIVINTCAVTNESERKSCQAIRRAKKLNPNAKIFVTGCASQINPEKYSTMPEVDKVVGNAEKMIKESYLPSDQKIIVSDIMQLKETAEFLIEGFGGKSRAFLEIQNGCNHRCTFCRIPYGRGNCRSVPPGVIARQIDTLINNGYKEIVLTGVDITDYGSDMEIKISLASLIRRLFVLFPNLLRLRLSSVDIAEIDDGLFDLLSNEKRLMPHVHISMQSGHDLILKRMKRRHNVKQVIDFCDELSKKRSDVVYGLDMIVGFPTETEEMFIESMDFMKRISAGYAHIFPYSKNDGTPAARMPQVAKSDIKRRAAIARAVANDLRDNLYRSAINKVHSVLIEDVTDEFASGHAENFLPLRVKGKFQNNDIVQMVPRYIENDILFADIANTNN